MKIILSLFIALIYCGSARGDGLIQPVYGSPKYKVEIWNPGTQEHRVGGTALDRGAYATSGVNARPVIPPFIWWVVDLGEVYIVEGYVENNTQLIIRMGQARMMVPSDSISFVPPGNADYEKAEKIYAACCKRADEIRVENMKRADAQQRAMAESAYRQMLLNAVAQPVKVIVY